MKWTWFLFLAHAVSYVCHFDTGCAFLWLLWLCFHDMSVWFCFPCLIMCMYLIYFWTASPTKEGCHWQAGRENRQTRQLANPAWYPHHCGWTCTSNSVAGSETPYQMASSLQNSSQPCEWPWTHPPRKKMTLTLICDLDMRTRPRFYCSLCV